MKRTACLILMLAVFSLTAFAQLDQAKRVSGTPGVPSMWPQTAFGPDGILHIVWVDNLTSLKSKVMYATYDGTTISEPIRIDSADTHQCFFPFIAMNSKGRIAVLWGQYNEHWLAEYDPDLKQWLAPVMVGPDWTGNGYLSRPKVAMDEDGNIYCYYFGNYRSFTRSKINGVWEGQMQLNNAGVPSKEGGVCAAPNGTIWIVYGTKQPGGDYKIAYRTRTKSTPWSNGALGPKLGKSQEQPFVGVGLNSIAYISYLGNDGREGSNVINLCTLDNDANSSKAIVGPSAFHYPRIAVDNLGFQHIASQFGQGDHGLGIQYFTNASGEWQGAGILPYSQGEPKLPGISSEAFGNIAVSFESFTDGVKEAYFATRYPVVPKHFNPPTGMTASIAYEGITGLTPALTYSLSWTKNPENNDEFIRGYKIYQKLGDAADWTEVIEVSKDTLTYSFTYGTDNPLTAKVQFAIATVSISGKAGDITAF